MERFRVSLGIGAAHGFGTVSVDRNSIVLSPGRVTAGLTHLGELNHADRTVHVSMVRRPGLHPTRVYFFEDGLEGQIDVSRRKGRRITTAIEDAGFTVETRRPWLIGQSRATVARVARAPRDTG